MIGYHKYTQQVHVWRHKGLRSSDFCRTRLDDRWILLLALLKVGEMVSGSSPSRLTRSASVAFPGGGTGLWPVFFFGIERYCKYFCTGSSNSDKISILRRIRLLIAFLVLRLCFVCCHLPLAFRNPSSAPLGRYALTCRISSSSISTVIFLPINAAVSPSR